VDGSPIHPRGRAGRSPQNHKRQIRKNRKFPNRKISQTQNETLKNIDFEIGFNKLVFLFFEIVGKIFASFPAQFATARGAYLMGGPFNSEVQRGEFWR
jgi:hypothetical protein